MLRSHELDVNQPILKLDQHYNQKMLISTWLRDNGYVIKYVQVPGYSLAYNNRKTGKRGGGSGFYIKENLTYKRRQNIVNINSTVEYLWI